MLSCLYVRTAQLIMTREALATILYFNYASSFTLYTSKWVTRLVRVLDYCIITLVAQIQGLPAWSFSWLSLALAIPYSWVKAILNTYKRLLRDHSEITQRASSTAAAGQSWIARWWSAVALCTVDNTICSTQGVLVRKLTGLTCQHKGSNKKYAF